MSNWTPVTATTNLQQSASRWNELVNAVKERQIAVLGVSVFADGTNTLFLHTRGNERPTAAEWAALQTQIEGLYSSFVVSHVAGVYVGDGYYDNGTAVFPTYGSLAAVFSAAGLPHSTWRAFVTRPEDGGTDQARKAQRGDLRGWWRYADVQAVLNVLMLQSAVPVSVNGYWRRGGKSIASPPYEWGDAVTGAESAWASSGEHGPEDGLGAYAESDGFKQDNGLGITEYSANISRIRTQKQVVIDPAVTTPRRIEFYASTAAIPRTYTTFDNNGDVPGYPLVASTYVLWSVSTDIAATSSYLGSTDNIPTWVGEPTDYEQHYQGWYTTDVKALVKWSFEYHG